MTSLAPFSPESPTESEWEYRAVSPWAVASLLLGVLSVAVAIHWLFIFIPLAGIIAGRKALCQLRQFGTLQTGIALAHVGIATSAFFGLSGVTFLLFVMSDVPHGYKEITFEDLQPNPGELVSRCAVELQPTLSSDHKVFIKGFIYPSRQTQEIKEFMLVPTLGHCSFCFTQIRPTDIIRVKLAGDLVVDYKTTEIGIGGRLRVDQLSEQAPYSLEADHVQ